MERRRPFLARAGATALLAALSGCMQQMAEQPAFRPLQPSPFFSDGRSARPLVAGTVHRDARRSSGKRDTDATDLGAATGVTETTAGLTSYVDAIPVEITEKLLRRGQQRFDIYCSVCHDRVGTGKGIIVQRGFTPPPSLHTDWSRGFKLRGFELKLRDAPVGYYFDVITHGFGAMPDYASQVPPEDRWAIVAYIRVLQFSQAAPLDAVPEAERKKLETLRGKQP